jgi:bacillithiol biosynthesis cysteine-adding enzyme BshC
VTSTTPTAAARLSLPCDRFLSGLAADLVAGRHRELLAPLAFIAPGPLPELRARAGERAAIASELERANSSYGHPRAHELAAKFADPRTLVVVAGQQAGLFGGPLYTLTKMAGIALVAERLERAGRPAVAAFWVATEDHDFAEVARATLLGPDGPVTLDLGDDPLPLLPVGMRTLGPTLEPVLEAVRALHPAADGGEAWRLLSFTSYRPDARFGEAFARLMVGLLGGRAPLLVDSMLPALKRAQRATLDRAVERRIEVAAALREQAARVLATGHALQVEEDPATAAPLFVLAGRERRRVSWEGADAGRWTLRGAAAPAREVAELRALIADNPALVSPGVLLRPIVQDAVLGTALQLMGPGELGYLAQASPLYRVLEVPAPRVALRPQMMVLDRKQRRQLESLELGLDELIGDARALDARLGQSDVADGVGRLRAAALAALDDLEDDCLALDPGLERPLAKTREQVDRALELFTGKVHAAAARRDQTARSRCDAVRAACLPGGAPQERTLAVGHFALRYGLGLGAAVLSGLDVESAAVQVVDPEGGG